MGRLLRIEWLKVKSFKAFWVFLAIYFIALLGMVIGSRSFLRFLKNQGAEYKGMDPTMIPLFDMSDVWHNVAYLSASLKILAGFIVITIVANEVRNRTLRQSIIDGMSYREYLAGKLLWNLAFALVASAVVWLIAFVAGSIYSPVHGLSYVWEGLQFILGHALIIFCFMCMSLMITLVLPRPGIVIIGLLVYSVIMEPLIAVFLRHYDGIPEAWSLLADMLPVSAINRVVQIPFPKYILQEVQTYVGWPQVLVALGWCGLFILGSYTALRRKDW